jgi:hypothetical protein
MQEGSFAGMLRRVSGPLLHQYVVPAFTAGPDLAWLRMTPAEAQAHMASLLGSIKAASVALFGQLPDPPTKLVLLQNTVRGFGGGHVACELLMCGLCLQGDSTTNSMHCQHQHLPGCMSSLVLQLPPIYIDNTLLTGGKCNTNMHCQHQL